MDYHQNARLAVHSREQMCESVVVKGLTLKLAAASFNVSQTWTPAPPHPALHTTHQR
jgi:hypothetical protein